MNRFCVRFRFLICCLAAALPACASYAADESSVLDLVPRDAAAFVHIRVADIWKLDKFKAVRDYLTNTEPRLLKDLEQDSSFRPTDVESITVIVPEFGGRDVIGAPLILVRTVQPYNKLKLLTALRAQTRAQLRADPFRGAIIESKPLKAPESSPKQPNEPKSEKEIKIVERKEVSTPFKPDVSARQYLLENERQFLLIIDDRTILIGFTKRRWDDDSLYAYCARALKRPNKGPLDGVLAAAAQKHMVVAGVDIADLRKNVPNMLDPRLHGLLAAKSATLTLDLNDEFALSLSVEAADAVAAKKVEDSFGDFLDSAKKTLAGMRQQAKEPAALFLNRLLDQAEMGLKNAKLETQGAVTRLTTSVAADEMLQATLKSALVQIKAARERAANMNNLHQIGLAAHNFHDTNGFLPFPGITESKEQGFKVNPKPNLSWRVAILPYMEQFNLYGQFAPSEPWDSEHNKKLLEQMPRIFTPPASANVPKGYTFYRTFVGPDTISAKPFALFDITDGTSNTIMVVEAAEAVPWTKPDELPYDPKKPLPKLGMFDGNFHALFADASVRYIRKDIPEKVLRALITPNGGEVIDWDWNR